MSNETPENRHYDSAEGSSFAVQGEGHERSSDAAAESDADASTVADDAPSTVTTAAAAAAAAAANDDDYHISNNTTVNDSSSAVAKGLYAMLSSVIRDFDSRAEDTVRSQDQLSFSIDRLTRELDQLLEDAPSPFIMQHAVKISGVRKRVSSLNIVLKSIQQRLDNIDRMLSVGLPPGILDQGADTRCFVTNKFVVRNFFFDLESNSVVVPLNCDGKELVLISGTWLMGLELFEMVTTVQLTSNPNGIWVDLRRKRRLFFD